MSASKVLQENFLWALSCLALFCMPLYVDKTSGTGLMHSLLVKTHYNGIFFSGLALLTLAFGWRIRGWSLVDKASLALCFFCALSLLWTSNVQATLYYLMLLGVAMIAYRLVLVVAVDMERLDSMVWALFLSGVVVAGVGVYDHWTPGFLWGNPTPVGSFFGNKNFATHFLILIFPLSVHLLVKPRVDYRLDVLVVFGGVLIALHLMYTQTRSAWVGIACAMVVAIAVWRLVFPRKLLSRTKKYILWTGVAAFLVLLNVSHEGFVLFWEQSGQALSLDSSKRWELWKGVKEAVLERPLQGWGLGTYTHWRFDHNTFGLKAARLHNEYLQLIYELGLLGCLAFAFFVAAIIKAFVCLFNEPVLIERQRVLVFCIMLSCIGTAAQSFFTFPYKLIVPLVTLATLLAMLSVLLHWAKKARPASGKGAEFLQFGFVFVCCFVFIVYTQWFLDAGDADDLIYLEEPASEFAHGRTTWVNDQWPDLLYQELPVLHKPSAVLRMQRLYKLNPSNVLVMRRLAAAYKRLGMVEKELEFRKLLYQKVLDTGVYQRFSIPYILGFVRAGKLDEAANVYAHMLEKTNAMLMKGDVHWEDLYAMAEGGMMVKDYKAALRFFELAAKVYDGVDKAVDSYAVNLALTYRNLGDDSSAEHWYKRALEAHPQHPKKSAILKWLVLREKVNAQGAQKKEAEFAIE